MIRNDAVRYVLTNLSDEIPSDTPVLPREGGADIRQKHRNLAAEAFTSSSFHSKNRSIRFVSLMSIEKECMYMVERNSLNANRNKGRSSDR